MLLLSVAAAAAPSREMPSDAGPWVVQASYAHERSLNLLLRRAAPWKVDRRARTLIVEVPTRFEYQQLLNEGFAVEVDARLTRAMYAPLERQPDQISGIAGYPCYRTVDESYARASRLAARFANLVEIIDIGDSWEKLNLASGGSDLRVVKLTNRALAGPKPKLFVQAALHAREYATSETLTRFMERLVQGYRTDADVSWILDTHEIHLLLVANPDGRRFAELPASRSQRKNRNANHCPSGDTLLGVDLNRNFPFDWGGLGSSGEDCNLNFRGIARLSEPENISISNYLSTIFPDQRNEQPIPAVDLTSPVSLDASGLFIDLHAPASAVWWPWGNVDGQLAPNALELQTLGRKLAYYNGYFPAQSNEGGAIAGASDDFVFATLGVASYTIEMGGDGFFPDCKSFEAELVEQNLAALMFAARVPRAPYRLPSGPEVIDISAPSNSLSSGRARIDITADDRRLSFVNGSEPLQVIESANAYLTPPWQPSATPIASFVFSDGQADSITEPMHALIAISALNPGRQLVYLQARDALGHLGPVSALWLTRGENPIFADGFE